MLIILVAFILPSLSSPDNIQTQMEIDHLITYIQGSGCIFVRNGKEHTPDEAVEHIRRKFEYFRDKIDGFVKSPISALCCILRHCDVG